jgi:hypothetical protein
MIELNRYFSVIKREVFPSSFFSLNLSHFREETSKYQYYSLEKQIYWRVKLFFSFY